MMICKKIFAPLFAILFSMNIALSAQTGRIDYNSVLFDYSQLDFNKIKKEADSFFALHKNSKDTETKEQYLNTAAGKYYILTKIDNTRLEPYVQLGRIYDEKNKARLAKENFCKAINLKSTDADANFYFGEFYYKRKDYKQALYYYDKAYNNGYNLKYILNLRLATIYEKLGDLSNAKNFYDVSYSMKPNSKLKKRILDIKNTDYYKSGYYD